MSDAESYKARKETPAEILALSDHGGLVAAACNGLWVCPRYRDIIYLNRYSLVGEHSLLVAMVFCTCHIRCLSRLLEIWLLHTCLNFSDVIHIKHNKLQYCLSFICILCLPHLS